MSDKAKFQLYLHTYLHFLCCNVPAMNITPTGNIHNLILQDKVSEYLPFHYIPITTTTSKVLASMHHWSAGSTLLSKDIPFTSLKTPGLLRKKRAIVNILRVATASQMLYLELGRSAVNRGSISLEDLPEKGS